MNLEILYIGFNVVVSIAWLLLIALPRWRWTDRLVHSIWLPSALAIWLFAMELLRPALPEGANLRSLQGIVLGTNGPHGTLMLWTQLMGWDLFIGAWLARDACRYQIHHGWVVACLLATFVFGPVGLLLYFVIRFALHGATGLLEANIKTA